MVCKITCFGLVCMYTVNENRLKLSCFSCRLRTVYSETPVTEWIITVGHRPNSEQNLPKAERFRERADTVAGLP